MFKVDWPCAVGGVFLGYYAKGKVISLVEKTKRISTDAINAFKESFSEDSQNTQPTQAGQAGQNSNGN